MTSNSPDYQRNYRKQHPEYVARQNALKRIKSRAKTELCAVYYSDYMDFRREGLGRLDARDALAQMYPVELLAIEFAMLQKEGLE